MSEDKPWRILALNTDDLHEITPDARSVRKVTDDLRALGLRSYAPEIQIDVRRARVLKSRRSRYELAFPGYLYIRLLRPTQKSLLQKLSGHDGFLTGASSKDFKLSDEEMLAIRAAEVTERLGWAIETAQKLSMEGKKVRVDDGPFSGFAGPVEQDHGTLIRVLLEIMGRMTPVELDPQQVSEVA